MDVHFIGSEPGQLRECGRSRYCRGRSPLRHWLVGRERRLERLSWLNLLDWLLSWHDLLLDRLRIYRRCLTDQARLSTHLGCRLL